MKFRNYQHLLEHMSKTQQVIVTISLWGYSTGRMTFQVPFDNIKKFLDGDMIFKYGDFPLKFKDIKGKPHTFNMYKLKISKVDYIETKELRPKEADKE